MGDNNQCDSDRIFHASAKVSDRCYSTFNGKEHDGYVPTEIGVGGWDYLRLDICLECGKLQGKFPVPDPEFAMDDEEDE